MAEEQCTVTVVGGGPVGLAMAVQLGRFGVDTILLERRDGPSRHPKATGVHSKTMELFRQWGIADRVREAAGLPPDSTSFVWGTRATAEPIGAIDLTQDIEKFSEALTQSPEFLTWCAQDAIEPILLREAMACPSVSACYRTAVTEVSQDAQGVSVVAQSEAGGVRHIRSRYLVAADGATGSTRERLGIRTVSTPSFGYHVNVCFRADLDAWLGERKHMMYWVVNSDSSGTLIALTKDRWIYHIGYDATKSAPSDFPPEVCVDTIRRAIDASQPEIPIEIENIVFWNLDTALAERFADNRIFLVGDAAHRFPPTGGFGMNSGIGDSHNLAWKLAAVVHGQAGPELLQTYEPERRPVAEANIRQAMINTERTAEVGWVLADAEAIAKIEDDVQGVEVRAAIAAAIPKQREGYWSQGQQFGYIYKSPAVVPDGRVAPESTVSDYRMTGAPGAHAPHLWLRSNDGSTISTIDLLHSKFVLLTSASAPEWVDALYAVARQLEVPAIAHTIGSNGDFEEVDASFLERYGLTESGAVLVRPDGHVGFRAERYVSDCENVLLQAVTQILAVPAISSGHGMPSAARSS